MMTVESILQEALALPEAEQWRLVARLHDRLEPDGEPGEWHPSPAEEGRVLEEWLEVACRREEEIASGRVRAVPAEEVFAHLQAKFAL